jgi:hypothetical protein
MKPSFFPRASLSLIAGFLTALSPGWAWAETAAPDALFCAETLAATERDVARFRPIVERQQSMLAKLGRGPDPRPAAPPARRPPNCEAALNAAKKDMQELVQLMKAQDAQLAQIQPRPKP